MQYTNEQLKRTLAKMLPETLIWDEESSQHNTDRPQDEGWGLCWDSGNPVLDTELLHLCWLVEEQLSVAQRREYFFHLFKTQRLDDGDLWKAIHPAWQQRTIALAQTLGIEIV